MPENKVLSGKKVLVVDDEPDILGTVEDILDMCQVEKASSFEEGKKLLESRDFDIAVLDVYRRHRQFKPKGIAALNEGGERLVRALADEIAGIVDHLIAADEGSKNG